MRTAIAALILLFAVPASAQKLKGVNLTPKTKITKKGAAKAPASDSLFEITSLDITSVRGKTFEVEARLFKPGAQVREPFVIYFVDGARKNEVYRGDARFGGTRGGVVNGISLDLSRFNPRRGHLEGVVLSCAQVAKCKKQVRIAGGDLFVDGRPTIESRGSDRILKLDIKNAGPNPMRNCKVVLEVDGSKVQEFQIADVDVNGKRPIEYRYRGNANKPYKARIDCNDLGSGNNVSSGRLQ